MASYLLVLLLYSYIHGGGAECRAFTTCGCGDWGYKEGKAFCDFEEDDGNCVPCSDYKKAKHCSTNGLPSAGEADCVACCFATPAPTATPAPSAAPTTSAPSISPAPTVTHVPTPAPTAPTNYWVLLTLVVAPASVVASAIFLICCRNTEGRYRLCAAAASVPHIVVMAAWTCWIATFLCSHCSMSIIPMLWLMSAGATFVAIVVTGWLVCKQPGEELPFSVAGYKFGATITSDTRRSTAAGEAPVVVAGEPPAEVIVAGEYVAP